MARTEHEDNDEDERWPAASGEWQVQRGTPVLAVAANHPYPSRSRQVVRNSVNTGHFQCPGVRPGARKVSGPPLRFCHFARVNISRTALTHSSSRRAEFLELETVGLPLYALKP
jgi:hypothetical protein